MNIFTFNKHRLFLPHSPLHFFYENKLSTNFSSFIVDRLEELRIDDNLLTSLPNTLKLLRNLKSVSASNNKISKLPDFMIAMRFSVVS